MWRQNKLHVLILDVHGHGWEDKLHCLHYTVALLIKASYTGLARQFEMCCIFSNHVCTNMLHAEWIGLTKCNNQNLWTGLLHDNTKLNQGKYAWFLWWIMWKTAFVVYFWKMCTITQTELYSPALIIMRSWCRLGLFSKPCKINECLKKIMIS